jgi:ATP-dependent Clp protease ATP-binding subunit ClpC
MRIRNTVAVDDPLAPYWEQLGEDGRRVMEYAVDEARRLQHNYVGTEHLLLGLLRDYPGSGARLLHRLGVDLEETRAAVLYVVGQGSAPATGRLGLAPRAKLALEAAVEAAREGQHDAVRPEHLLLALLHGEAAGDPGRGVAAGILHGFGVSAERVVAELPATLAEEDGGDDLRHLVKGGRWEEATQAIAKWRERRRQGRRYSLVLPEELFAEVERLAERQQTTVVELLRRFTRLGLLVTQLQERQDAALIVREGGTERQLLLL